ncbi:MAG: spore maturation protein A [Clostridia bacterium]|nr:spore maturation protein A [Clostridia bacterium]
MNLPFIFMVLLATVLLLWKDPTLLLPALTEGGTKAVELSLKMLAIYAVWMGVLALCEASGASKLLSRLLKPAVRLLYGKLPSSAAEQLSVNMAANLLGMGNAATPAAINAVRLLPANGERAGFAMVMLVVINATSLQLIPTTVISLRQAFYSANAADILLPTLISSGAATLLGILLTVLLCKRHP